jgi:monofunctional biosynthetic peptidoglycan transglycosylase
VYAYLTLPDVRPLATDNPESTAFMELRDREARAKGEEPKRVQHWVDYNRISPSLKRAVLVAEDAAFWSHDGLDYDELRKAIELDWQKGQLVRGASTITQQLAKNLFLSTEKSLLRKLKEYFLAKRLENELSKNRIFHMYLNVIELGPGIFGVEAAARHFYGKSVSQLNLDEIVRLTAVIPKPLSESPTRLSRWLKWKARWILSVLRKTEHIGVEQFNQTIGRFK